MTWRIIATRVAVGLGLPVIRDAALRGVSFAVGLLAVPAVVLPCAVASFGAGLLCGLLPDVCIVVARGLFGW